MKQRIQGIFVGFLIATVFFSGTILAVTGTQSLSVTYRDIKLCIDGKMITPTDANGNAVEPFIADGTTYLPVRAVANALGKEVYWDGANFTVYLGSMNGTLQYPSLKLEDAVNIGDRLYSTNDKTDNYNNSYAMASNLGGNIADKTFETLLNMKYSSFKGTVYVPLGTTNGGEWSFRIEADGKVIYSSPTMTKTSAPVNFDVNITGCNDFKIILSSSSGYVLRFGDCGFYQ